jgi:predicted transcriptional regulator
MTDTLHKDDDASGSKLTRLTVNLTPKTAEALDHVAALTRDSRTDSVNRAIQFYDFMMTYQAQGSAILLRHPGEDDLDRVRIL